VKVNPLVEAPVFDEHVEEDQLSDSGAVAELQQYEEEPEEGEEAEHMPVAEVEAEG
jgi:hypothetical protein